MTVRCEAAAGGAATGAGAAAAIAFFVAGPRGDAAGPGPGRQVSRHEAHREGVGALVEIAELDVVIDQAVERLQLVRAEDARQHAVPGEPRQGGGGRGG